MKYILRSVYTPAVLKNNALEQLPPILVLNLTERKQLTVYRFIGLRSGKQKHALKNCVLASKTACYYCSKAEFSSLQFKDD